MPIKAPKGFIDESDPKVCQIGHPAPPWLVNYADLMTELVCFFIILYALSASLNKGVQQAAQEVKEVMKEQKVAGEVKIDREGLKISIEENGDIAFFNSGKADITPGMAALLDKIAPKLKDLSQKYEIVVEGHTDNIPINDEYFASNWELSSARATEVVDYFIRQRGFSPLAMAAMGYGEFRPVAPNDTAANRARNRRVVFFVKTVVPRAQTLPGHASTAPVAGVPIAPAGTPVAEISAAGATPTAAAPPAGEPAPAAAVQENNP
ncbi:MAG: OmpA family protein [Elusimicrobiota bacterium]|jgi:flagellar motor protein MotB